MSKGKELSYSKLGTQPYFKSGNGLSPEDMRRIYALRTRALPLKCNSPSQYSDRLCLVNECTGEDREIHIYSCEFLTDGNEVTICNTSYEDIYKNNVLNQKTIMERFFERFQRRKKLQPSHCRDGPEAPQGSKPSGSRGVREEKNK